MVGVLIVQTEAGLLPAAAPLVPATFPQQLYARSAYSQVVGRSYAPSSFVPVASAGIAYAAAPALVTGPVLKTLAPARAVPVAPALSYAALPALGYAAAAAPVPTAFAPAALARAYAPLPALPTLPALPALPAPILPSAPLAPGLAPVAPSQPGVFDARNAPNAPATRTTNPTIVSAFGSPAGIRLVGLPGVQTAVPNSQQNPQEEQTNVEIARGSPANERSATGGPVGAASNQEAFGVPVPSQPSPFNEYGVPAPVTSRVNP
ncbi:translation initiation factor IF-2-like [Anopheles aquasalis]|uniref:translation initiation factor IF-2-like n=1 Tax=Anopheles aquasalis TaxID=42839 RepID=UPI00215A9943|nr:translation initiation factor IF-2-like [Anopheles aquasalis]